MAKFILGKKLGMTQIFDEQGNEIPVTLIEAGPCFVTQIKTEDKDNYSAAQIGFIPGKKLRCLREFRNGGEYKVGDKIDASVFQEGDLVKVSGISKGKGFAGAVKKEGVHGKNKSHGTKHEERQTGSTGSSRPSRVIKGVKMAGRLGYERVSVKNLKIVEIDKENNIIAVRGAVPGARGTLLEISSI